LFTRHLDGSSGIRHSSDWECRQIAHAFLTLGYDVDVIHWQDTSFIPRKNYALFVDTHSNLERIGPLLNPDCIKILHIVWAHWLFHNNAHYVRLRYLQERKGIVLKPDRLLLPSSAIEHANFATMLGNEFTANTYRYAEKPIFRVPISTSAIYPWPEKKDFDACRRHFVWFGGSGLIHKGLDVVLDAFMQLPNYRLTVCGPVKSNKDFEQAYFRELYETPNIRTVGWVDVTSPQFTQIANNSLGLIHPSCSEGGGGAVINCMHAGLIPIVTYESSVDVHDFGIMLKNCSVDEIKRSVQEVSNLPSEELRARARRAWEFARANHTREHFATRYEQIIREILDIQRKAQYGFQSAMPEAHRGEA
jgi:glycosyltransferase involved in cell wall biosynthesis